MAVYTQLPDNVWTVSGELEAARVELFVQNMHDLFLWLNNHIKKNIVVHSQYYLVLIQSNPSIATTQSKHKKSSL